MTDLTELSRSPFLGSAAVRDGILTRTQLRGATYRRVLRDVYVRRDVALDSATRAAAVSLVLPPGSVLSGRSAAWLLSGLPFRHDEPIEVTLPRGTPMKPRTGVLIRRAFVAPEDISTVSGVGVTDVLRTGFDLARRRRPGNSAELTESVVALDALTRGCRLDGDELLQYTATHPRWRGVRLVAEAVRLVDPGAESPMETRLRLILVLGGLPAPVSQHEIRDSTGGFIARVDLAYPSLRIAIEYDGEQHRDRWAQDIVRQNQIIGLGWTVLRYTSRDVYRRQISILAEVTAARSAALAA